jgi:hypothetical protein
MAGMTRHRVPSTRNGANWSNSIHVTLAAFKHRFNLILQQPLSQSDCTFQLHIAIRAIVCISETSVAGAHEALTPT